MTTDEIKATWDELSEAEAFEAFDADSVDNATIVRVLGENVADDYSGWQYINIK